jgi:methyl-accepting chemotaxis protein
VRDVANETGQVASVVFEEAKSVSEASDRLKMEIAKFLNSMRAA